MKKSRVEIKKIPVKDLIETLIDILNNEVEFINLIVEKGNHQDSIWLVESDSISKTVPINNSSNFEDLI